MEEYRRTQKNTGEHVIMNDIRIKLRMYEVIMGKERLPFLHEIRHDTVGTRFDRVPTVFRVFSELESPVYGNNVLDKPIQAIYSIYMWKEIPIFYRMVCSYCVVGVFIPVFHTLLAQ
jgi:hypothetical protein